MSFFQNPAAAPSQRGVVDGAQHQRVKLAAGGRDRHGGDPGPRGVEGRVRVAGKYRKGLNHGGGRHAGGGRPSERGRGGVAAPASRVHAWL